MRDFTRQIRILLVCVFLMQTGWSAQQVRPRGGVLSENGFRYPQALAGMDSTACSWTTTVLASNLTNNTVDCAARVEIQGGGESVLQINGETTRVAEISVGTQATTRFTIASEGPLTDFGLIVSSSDEMLSCQANLATSLTYSQTCEGGITETISVDRPFIAMDTQDCFSFAYNPGREYGLAFASSELNSASAGVELISSGTTAARGLFRISAEPEARLLRDIIIEGELPTTPGYARVCLGIFGPQPRTTIFATALSYSISDGTVQFGTLPLREASETCAVTRTLACENLPFFGWTRVQVVLDGADEFADLVQTEANAYTVQLPGQPPLGDIVIVGFDRLPGLRSGVGVVYAFDLFDEDTPAGLEIRLAQANGLDPVVLTVEDFTLLESAGGSVHVAEFQLNPF